MRRRLSKSGGGLALEAELGYDTGTTNSPWRFSTPPTRFLSQTIKSICGGASELCKRTRTRVGKLGGDVWSPEDLLNELAPGGSFPILFPQTKSPSGAKWFSQNRKISGFPESGSKKFPEKSGRKKFAECAKKKTAASARLVRVALGEAYPLDGGLKVVAAV